MTRRISETNVEAQLAPTLSQGEEVILDKLPAHKSEKAAQFPTQRGACFPFLPLFSYSGDFRSSLLGGRFRQFG